MKYNFVESEESEEAPIFEDQADSSSNLITEKTEVEDREKAFPKAELLNREHFIQRSNYLSEPSNRGVW